MKEIKREELVEGKVYFDSLINLTKLKFIRRGEGLLYFKPLNDDHIYEENQLGEIEFLDKEINPFYEGSGE